MAEISKKPLLDSDSNLFLESRGFINIINSFAGSSWKKPGINLIFNLDNDVLVRNDNDLYILFYELGYEKGTDDLTKRSFVKDFI